MKKRKGEKKVKDKKTRGYTIKEAFQQSLKTPNRTNKITVTFWEKRTTIEKKELHT